MRGTEVCGKLLPFLLSLSYDCHGLSAFLSTIWHSLFLNYHQYKRQEQLHNKKALRAKLLINFWSHLSFIHMSYWHITCLIRDWKHHILPKNTPINQKTIELANKCQLGGKQGQQFTGRRSLWKVLPFYFHCCLFICICCLAVTLYVVNFLIHFHYRNSQTKVSGCRAIDYFALRDIFLHFLFCIYMGDLVRICKSKYSCKQNKIINLRTFN